MSTRSIPPESLPKEGESDDEAAERIVDAIFARFHPEEFAKIKELRGEK